jgi:GTP-binding protein
MRRKARVRNEKTALEYHMVLRSLRAVDRSDVAILVCESGGITDQDTKIAGYAHEAGKAVLIAVNKWDLIQAEDENLRRDRLTAAQQDFQAMITRYLPFISYAPVHFVSALTGAGVEAMMDDALEIAPNVHERIATSVLNDLIRRAVADRPPPSVKGQQVKVRYATQADVSPPTIIIFSNHPELLHFSYVRYLENNIRARFPFRGVPLKIELRKSGGRDDEDSEWKPRRTDKPVSSKAIPAKAAEKKPASKSRAARPASKAGAARGSRPAGPTAGKSGGRKPTTGRAATGKPAARKPREKS